MTYRINKLPDMERIYWPSSNHLKKSRKLQAERQYIDPWDMENIAYISRNMNPSMNDDDDEDLSTMGAAPSPAGEPAISTTFYYIPGGNVGDDCAGCYAGMEEELFYNAKYETIVDDDDDDDQPSSYSTYYTGSEITDIESSSTERNSSCGSSTVSTLQLHTPGFGVRASGRRSIVLPKPIPQIEFPAPPSRPPTTNTFVSHEHNYQYDSYDNTTNATAAYQSLSPSMTGDEPIYSGNYDCYDCLMINENHHVPLYVTKQQYQPKLPHVEDLYQQYPPNNFGLSKKGLLQIDYSFNWNNLHRFMNK